MVLAGGCRNRNGPANGRRPGRVNLEWTKSPAGFGIGDGYQFQPKDSGLTGLLPAARQPAVSRAFCPQLGYIGTLPKTLEMVLRILRRG